MRTILRTLINGSLHPFGMELRRKHDPARLLKALKLGTVIDGGANDGDFAAYARAVSPTAVIHSFEPVPSLFAALTNRFKVDTRFVGYQIALGDTKRIADFEINLNQHSSSLLPIRAGAGEVFEGLAPVGTIQVEVITLDEWSQGRQLPAPVLLKLDLEGGELAALRGATALLQLVDYVLAEINLVFLRQGQPGFMDIAKFLGGLGFDIMDVYPGHLNKRTGQAIWADTLFKKNLGRA